jgi:hypothetical protein
MFGYGIVLEEGRGEEGKKGKGDSYLQVQKTQLTIDEVVSESK